MYSILYYIILYYSILYYALLSYIILCYITLHYIILCFVILYYIMLYYITLHFIIYYIISYYFILYYIILYIQQAKMEYCQNPTIFAIENQVDFYIWIYTPENQHDNGRSLFFGIEHRSLKGTYFPTTEMSTLDKFWVIVWVNLEWISSGCVRSRTLKCISLLVFLPGDFFLSIMGCITLKPPFGEYFFSTTEQSQI